MSLAAATLLLLSAFTHAGWNYLSKKHHPSLSYYLAANTIGVLCMSPLLPWYWSRITLIPGTVWIFVTISGVLLAVYMAALAGAYRTGDLSIAYPIARSLPVIFVAAASVLFGLGQALDIWFAIGGVLIVGGCVLLPLRCFSGFSVRALGGVSGLLAMSAAVCIAGYTVVDHQALARLRNLPGRPFSPIDATLLYMVVEGISASIWKGALVLCSRRERRNLKGVLSDFKFSAAITGIGIFSTYGLVLASMNFVANVSYVAAFRQLSIPIGAILGMLFLHEPRYLPKVTGIGLIFAGLILTTV